MPELLGNNGQSTLAADITNVATSLTVQTGHGARFPNPSSPDYFYVTLDDGTNVEIVKCTARSTDTLTVTRAQQGTSAVAFAAATPTKVEQRLTAAAFDAFRQKNTTGTISPTPAGNQNDYAPSGWADARTVKLSPSVAIVITGFAAGEDGERKLLIAASDFPMILARESTSSSAANRLTWPSGLPLFFLPGDTVEIVYDATAARWRMVDQSKAAAQMQFEAWDDCIASSTVFGNRLTGTGTAATVVNDGNNTTEKTQGVIQMGTGTTATGRSYVTSGVVGNVIVPTLGQMLHLARVNPPVASNGTQRFQVITGMHDAAEGTNVTDGYYWKYNDAASANWERCTANGGTRTETASGKAVTAATYIWLGVYVNAAGTRADFFYSDDSVTWTFDGANTANMPTSTALVQPSCGINKTVGTTASLLNIDAQGYRFDYVRA